MAVNASIARVQVAWKQEGGVGCAQPATYTCGTEQPAHLVPIDLAAAAMKPISSRPAAFALCQARGIRELGQTVGGRTKGKGQLAESVKEEVPVLLASEHPAFIEPLLG